MQESGNNKRIAKNTLALYLRMFIMTCISLYTSRIMLQALGVDNLGIYNVVGGVVGLMSILNGAMAISTLRYLNFGLGQGDMKKMAQVFTTCFIIYVILCSILFLASETLGLWIVNHKLLIPSNRLLAANCVYQFSIITSITSLLVSPYSAAIIAREKMSVYAYFSIINAVLQLLIVYLIQILPMDVLVSYGLLLLFVSLSNSAFNVWYCVRHFPECKLIYYFNRNKIREILSYSGWNLFGSMGGVLRVQGTAILLNMFFNPTVNAAMAIASQVNGKVEMFFTNFMMAVRPQIFQYYAQNDLDKMNKLVVRSSKFSYYLIFFMGLPVLLESPFLIKLWLGQLPEYVITFVRLMIVLSAIEAMTQPIMTSVHATGNIKFYQICVGSVMMANIPISYICLFMGATPYVVIIVSIILAICCIFLRLWVLQRLMSFPVMYYLKNAYSGPVLVTLTATLLPLSLHCHLESSPFSVLVVCVSSIMCTLLCIYFLGLTTGERLYLRSMVLDKFAKYV